MNCADCKKKLQDDGGWGEPQRCVGCYCTGHPGLALALGVRIPQLFKEYRKFGREPGYITGRETESVT